MRLRWHEEPAKDDWRAARDYLTLLMLPSDAMELAQLLRDESASARFKAKDIVRAAGLEVLPASNRHVRATLQRIKRGGKLSPVLLVRPLALGSPLVIADGYERMCAADHAAPDVPIPCRIIGAPGVWRVSR